MQSWTNERRQVANACRVLAQRGLVDDVLGHVSLRVGEDAVLVRCRGREERGLAFTTVDDIQVVALDGSYDLPVGFSAPNELPLHLALHARNDGVRAVVHAHPPAVVAFTLTGELLRPIIGSFNIPAMRLALGGIPVHGSSALIRNPERALAMVQTLGERPVCLLRGHGLTATGGTVPEAVIRAINVDALARMHLSVMAAGHVPSSIDDDDLRDLPDLGSSFNDDNVWRFHLASLEHAGLLIC